MRHGGIVFWCKHGGIVIEGTWLKDHALSIFIVILVSLGKCGCFKL